MLVKYVFLNHLQIITRKKNILVIYFLCIVAFCIFSLSIQSDEIPLKALGLLYGKELIEKLIYMLNYAFYIYMILVLFFNDLKMGIQNLLTRMNKKKYLFFKFLNIFLFILLCKIITHILVILICQCSFSLQLIFTDLNIWLFLELCLLILLLLLNSKMALIVEIIFIIIMILLKIPSNYVMLLSIILFIAYENLTGFITKLYERNE